MPLKQNAVNNGNQEGTTNNLMLGENLNRSEQLTKTQKMKKKMKSKIEVTTQEAQGHFIFGGSSPPRTEHNRTEELVVIFDPSSNSDELHSIADAVRRVSDFINNVNKENQAFYVTKENTNRKVV